MADTVWLEERLSKVVDCVVAPPSQEVGCVVVVGVWWNVINVIVCLLVLTRLCCTIGIVCGLLVVGP